MPITSHPPMQRISVIRGETRIITFSNVPHHHPAFQIQSGNLLYYTPSSTLQRRKWFHALVVAAQNFVEFNKHGEMLTNITIRLLIQWDASHHSPKRQTNPQIERSRTIEIQECTSLPQLPYPWSLVDQRTIRSQWEADSENEPPGGFQGLWVSVQSLVYRLLWRSEQRTPENQENQTV